MAMRTLSLGLVPNNGITVFPDVTIPPSPSDLLSVKSVTAGVVNLGFEAASVVTGATVAVADTAPPAALPGALWFDSSNPALYLRYNDGNSTQWVATNNDAAIGTVKIADNPPTAADNSLWWDSSGTGLYVRYNDGNSTQWVAAQNPYTLTDAPNDGHLYARQSAHWVDVGSGVYLPINGGTTTGSICIGTGIGTPTLTLNGAAGADKGVYWQNAGTNRWRLQTDASDNLALYAYDPSGTYLNAAFTAQQSDMSVWFNFKLATNNTNATGVNGITGVQFNATNTGVNPASGNKFVYTSSAGGGGFDCGLVDIAIFNTNFATGAPNPAQQGEWRVTVSPNDATHFFGTNCAEWNIVNRGVDQGWMRDRGSGRNPTGGLLIVPETASFDPIAGGEGTNTTYGFSTAGSGAANSHGIYPRFYNNYLVEPNSTVGQTGRGMYMTGDITGTSANYPYGPMQIEGTWLHGIDHTKATYTDGRAGTMAVGQAMGWITGLTQAPSAVATITGTGPSTAVSLTLTPAGTGTINLAGNSLVRTAYNPSLACWDTGQAAGAGMLLGGGSLLYIATLDTLGDYVGTRCTIDASGNTALQGGLGVFGHAALASKPTVNGAKGSNAALTSLLTALAAYGLVTDSTTA